MIGVVAGTFAALFGVGGGIVIVPLLVGWTGFPVKHATATSLAAILLTGALGAARYAASGRVHFDQALPVAVAGVGGVLIGLHVRKALPGRVVTYVFATLLVVVAIGFLAP